MTMRIEATGPRVVTAGDIRPQGTVEIVNPETPICTLDSEDARLEMDLIVETGRGYVPAESKEDQPIGQIPVDAIFSPVEKVNYLVENTRVGQMTNFDRITLQVWTDGTINPDEALRQASNVLVQRFQMIADHTGPVEVTPGGSGHRGWADKLPDSAEDLRHADRGVGPDGARVQLPEAQRPDEDRAGVSDRAARTCSRCATSARRAWTSCATAYWRGGCCRRRLNSSAAGRRTRASASRG